MQELAYQRPTRIADAIGLLAHDGARALAGGSDLVPQLREGRLGASVVVDLKHVSELTAITQLPDGSWHVGAATSIHALGRHAAFSAAFPGLVAAARLIGSLQIQSRSTLGGNLCNAAPSADAVPLLIAHDAIVQIADANGRTTRAAADFAQGPGKTQLQHGQLVTRIELPKPVPRSAATYLRFTPRREMDIAIVGSGVRLDIDSSGAILDARIVLASVAPVPLIAASAQSLLVGETPSAALFNAAGARAAHEARPISDTRGSADYRRELAAVLTRRALVDCARQLGMMLP